jgi:hypothetical protein
MNAIMSKSARIAQVFVSLVWLVALCLPLQAESPVFTEYYDSLVVWDDLTVSEEKSYSTIVVMRGSLDLAGSTDSLVIVDGRVHLTETAKVRESVVLISGHLSQAEGAEVPAVQSPLAAPHWLSSHVHQLRNRWEAFKESWKKDEPTAEEGSGWWKLVTLPFYILGILAGAVVLLVLSFLFFMVTPRLSGRAEKTAIERPFVSLIVGFVGYLAVIPIAILLIISIVGILALPFYLIGVMLVAFVGLFAGFRAVGSFVLNRVGVSNFILSTTLGMLLALALSFAPFVGGAVIYLVWLWGTGALLHSAFIRENGEFVTASFRRVY